MGSSSDNIDLGVESLLGFGDGETAADLHARLDTALAYIANWYRAVDGSDNEKVWYQKIDNVRAQVEAAEKAISPDMVFPGTHEIALYNEAGSSFATLYNELSNSADTLPSPSLLSVPADLLDNILSAPGVALQRALNALGNGLGNGLNAATGKLWPYVLVGGVVVGAYLFWPALKRVAGKVGS